MEEITMEKLLNDFNSVIADFNNLVEKKDIDGVKKALQEVRNLVDTANEVELDRLEDKGYDHVLHRLLDQFDGYIENREVVEVSFEEIEISEEDRLLYERLEIEERELIVRRSSIENDIGNQSETSEISVEGVRKSVIQDKIDRYKYALNPIDVNARIEELERNIQTHRDIIDRLVVNDGNPEYIKNNEAKIAEFEAEISNLRQQPIQTISEEERKRIETVLPDLEDLLKYSNSDFKYVSLLLDLEDFNSDLEYISLDQINSIIAQYIKKRDELLRNDNIDRDNDSTNNEIEAIRTEISQKESELRSVARTRQAAREQGEDAVEAQANSDYAKLVEEIGALRTRLEEISRTSNEKPRLEEIDSEITRLNDLIASHEDEIRRLEEQYEVADTYDQTGILNRIDQLNREIEEARNHIEELETIRTEISQKEAELRSIARTRQVAREQGEDAVEAQANSDYAKLVEEISDLKSRLDALTKNNDKKDVNPNQEEIDSLNAKIAELQGIAALKETFVEKTSNKDDLLKNNKEYLLIEERLRKITEEKLAILKKYNITITENGYLYEKDNSLDVKEIVNEIGDKIFKTAKIREELSSRNVTREEFLAFYQAGRQASASAIQNLNNDRKEIDELVAKIFTDENSTESLYQQWRENQENGDNDKYIQASESIRKSFLNTGKFSDEILNTEIKTKEDADKFSKYIENFKGNYEKQIAEINSLMAEHKENYDIFNYEIYQIEQELKTINGYEEERKDIFDRADAEKDLRARQIRATMFGDAELEEEWNERFERFTSHKEKRTYKYIDENGEDKEIEYETVADYPEMKEDAYFLNLEEYKNNLELSSKYKASNGDIYALGEGIVNSAQKSAQVHGWDKTIQKLEEEVSKAKHYVDTYHGHINEHKVRHDVYGTAGSTLKSMVPIKNLPPAKKVGAITSNVFRFFGIRAPKFTRIDDHGNKVRDIKGGVLTLVTDAAVIGAVGITAATLGPAVAGLGYAAKGVVTLGNKVAQKITKARHKDDIEQNNIDLYHAKKDAREVARKEFYRDEYIEKTGKPHKIRAWFKAKADRVFTRKRARETEEKIVNRRIEQSNRDRDIKTMKTVSTLDENYRKSKENQETRQSNYEKVSRSANTYNDIVRDPDSVNMGQAVENIAQTAALGTYKEAHVNVNPNSQVPNKNQYVKLEEELKATEQLEEVKREAGSVANTAITIEQHLTGRQQKQDRINRVLTVVLSAVGKLGIDAITKRLTREVQLPDETRTVPKTEDIYEDQIVGYEEQVTQQPVYDTVTTKTTPSKLTDYEVSTDALDNTYIGDSTPFANDVLTVNNPSTVADPNALSIQYFDSTGKETVISIAEQNAGYIAGKHVNALGNFDISSMTPAEVLQHIEAANPNGYAQIVADLGIDKANVTDIWNELVQKGAVNLQATGMKGWQNVLADNVQETTQSIFSHYEDIIQQVPIWDKVKIGEKIVEDVVTIPGGTKTIVDTSKIIKATLEGAAGGAIIATADGIHEAIHQTRKVRPGTFEETNEYADEDYFYTVVERNQKKINDKKAKEKEEIETEDVEVDDDAR